MKTIKILSILAFALVMLTGCEDDFGKNYKPAQVGDDIVFGGTSGYEEEARTVYGDKTATGTEIMWYVGDKVRIYCNEAKRVNGNSFCDYVVNNVVPAGEDPKADKHNDKTASTLTTAEEYGLQWGEGADAAGTHRFYGVYPSPDMFAEGSTEAKTYNLNGNTLTAYLPSNQSPKAYVAADASGNYTIHPAMRFAYMTANNTATHTTAGVDLVFRPIVTAVEITLQNVSKASVDFGGGNKELAIENISGVRISTTDNTKISGKFTANVADAAITSVDEAQGNNYVEIAVNDEQGYPITLDYGKTLKFTAFLALPANVDLGQLKITILQSGGIERSTVISNPGGSTSKPNNDGVLVNAKKKNFISGVKINWDTNVQVDLSEWLATVKGNTLLGMLSIPGAGGSGSHNLSATYETSKQQTLDIEALWDSGIRCFEINTDGEADDVVCNGRATGLTLTNVLNAIQAQIKEHPTEFALVIIGYESITDTGAFGRNAASWVQKFNSTWGSVNTNFTGTKTVTINGVRKTITHKTALFKPSMTLDDARGKLFCISRPTAIGGDPWWYSVYANKQNVIPALGWGPSPDQFYARGYTRLNRPYLMGKSTTTTTRTEKWYYRRNYSSTPDVKVIQSENAPTTSGAPISDESKNALVSYGSNYLYPFYESMGVNYNLTNTSASEHLSGVLGSANNKFMYRTIKNVLTTSELANGNEATWKFDESLRIYAQEWKRIIKEDVTYKVAGVTNESDNSSSVVMTNNDSYTHNGTTYTRSKTVTVTTTQIDNEWYWRESLTEKKNDILTALNKATQATDQSTTIYINSLCGFYVIDDKKSYAPQPHRLRFYAGGQNYYGKNEVAVFNDIKYESYYSDDDNSMYDYFGGTTGDIANCAADLNAFFYNELLQLGVANLTGPTGVILMDRVKNQVSTDADKPGYYLPRFIIENTLRHYRVSIDDNIVDGDGTGSK